MNFGDIEEFNLTEDVRDIERRFCEFYLEVVMDYFDIDGDYIWMEKEFQNRKKTSKKNDSLQEPREMFLLGIENTCLALRKFYASLMKYTEVVKYITKKNPIKIHCLIGDSFFAALGMCIVIDEAVIQYGALDKNCLKRIQVSVTDNRGKWKNLCFFVVRKIEYFYKNIKIELEFNNESPYRLSEDLIGRIHDADILVMTRFLSTFQTLPLLTRFLKVILENMKEFSTLFYLDNMHYDKFKEIISRNVSWMEIKSKKAVYESLEDWGNTEFYSQFPILFTSTFTHVFFSTCVKCPGLKEHCLNKKDTKHDSKLLKEFRKEMKLVISDSFEKENSILSSASVLENLTISSIGSANNSVEKNAQRNASKMNKRYMLSKCSKLSAEEISSINAAEGKNLTIPSKCSKTSAEKVSSMNAAEGENLTMPSECLKVSAEKIYSINAAEGQNLTIPSKCSKISGQKFLPINESGTRSKCSSKFSASNNSSINPSKAKNITRQSRCSSEIAIGKFSPTNAPKARNLIIPSECSSDKSVAKIIPLNAAEAKKQTKPSQYFSKRPLAKTTSTNASEGNNEIKPFECPPYISNEGDLLSETNKLFMPSKCSSHISIDKNGPEMASGVEETTKTSKNCNNKNNSPFTLKISSSSKKNKNKLLKQCCKVGKIVRPPAIFHKRELTAEMFKKDY